MSIPPDHPRRETPRLGPGGPLGVTEPMIRELVHGFYGKVRLDPDLGPIFERAVGDHWDVHLAKLCDFWSSVVLATGRFQGRPMGAHLRLPEIRAEHFAIWLGLFEETARQVCPPEAAELFMARARMIARSFQLGLAAHRGEAPAVAPVRPRRPSLKFTA